jgi:thiamine-phosphate pyrophosphorylase
MSLDLRVYLVTDPSHRELPALVSAAIAGGVTCLQVRDKQAVPADRARAVRQISAAVDGRVPVIVDDDVEAARAAAGVHLGAHDVAPAAARSALGPSAIIGWSIGDVAQLEDDQQLAACDYVAASPVWSTPTKPDAGPPLGLAGVRALAERLQGRLPLVAIGGIHASNAGDVIAAGADGVAVVSAICGAEDPADAARVLRAAVDRALELRSVRP